MFNEETEQATAVIKVMRSDGSRKRPVTGGSHPAFAPNGKRLAYLGDTSRPGGESNVEIFTVRLDGERRRQVTRTPRPVAVYSLDWAVSAGRSD